MVRGSLPSPINCLTIVSLRRRGSHTVGDYRFCAHGTRHPLFRSQWLGRPLCPDMTMVPSESDLTNGVFGKQTGLFQVRLYPRWTMSINYKLNAPYMSSLSVRPSDCAVFVNYDSKPMQSAIRGKLFLARLHVGTALSGALNILQSTLNGLSPEGVRTRTRGGSCCASRSHADEITKISEMVPTNYTSSCLENL